MAVAIGIRDSYFKEKKNAAILYALLTIDQKLMVDNGKSSNIEELIEAMQDGKVFTKTDIFRKLLEMLILWTRTGAENVPV